MRLALGRRCKRILIGGSRRLAVHLHPAHTHTHKVYTLLLTPRSPRLRICPGISTLPRSRPQGPATLWAPQAPPGPHRQVDCSPRPRHARIMGGAEFQPTVDRAQTRTLPEAPGNRKGFDLGNLDPSTTGETSLMYARERGCRRCLCAGRGAKDVSIRIRRQAP